MIKSSSSMLGGILLIAGTAIGAGILALPIITAFGGFIPSICIFVLIWAVMLLSAYFMLDVHLSLGGTANILSMADKTLGRFGKVSSCIFYLLLLYSLLAAYLAACTPLIVQGIEAIFPWEVPAWISPFFLPILFGIGLCFGVVGIDYINRLFMVGLSLSYFFLIGTVPTHIEAPRLLHQDWAASLIAAPVVITSFGYHIIIPTLAGYLRHRESLLRKMIWIGSLIPLVVCLLWQWVILGAVPLKDLVMAWVHGAPATDPLSLVVRKGWIFFAAQFFSFFALITSFSGVTLSLSDFLKDGLSLKKNWKGRGIAIALVFVPPLIFLFFYQKAFYLALEYAGAFVAILLGIFPALMVLRLKKHPFYSSFLGRMAIALVLLVSLGIVGIDIIEKLGRFRPVLAQYMRLLLQ